MSEKNRSMTTNPMRFMGVILIVAVIVLAAMPASATTTYYRVTDLAPFNGVGASGVISPLNDYIPPASGWVLGEVTETFPTGHLIGWGTHSLQLRYFGLTPLLPGDGNADGLVNGGDLSIWQQHYDPIGVSGPTFFTADWNEDDKVNGGDLALWQQNYSPIAETEFPYLPDPPIGTHAPEPLTVLGIFLGLGSVGAYIRKRRTA